MPKILEKKHKRKEKHKKILRILIIILIIHILLTIIKIPITQEQSVETTFRVNNTPEKIEEQYERQCFRKSFDWDFQWEGYNDVESHSISPKFRLFNDEDRKGRYYVQFAFFDQAKHDFSKYRGKPYMTVIDELPWSAASMHSENISVTMPANQDKLITSYTRKLDTAAQYWVYALVTEPRYNKCETISVKINKSQEQQVLKETEQNPIESETQFKSLWQILIDFLLGE